MFDSVRLDMDECLIQEVTAPWSIKHLDQKHTYSYKVFTKGNSRPRTHLHLPYERTSR